MKIVSLDVRDIRFPTSLSLDGSDAMHESPDDSCAYVVLRTDAGLDGCGLTSRRKRPAHLSTLIVVWAMMSAPENTEGRWL